MNGEKSNSQLSIGLIDHACENQKCGKHFFTANKAKKYCSNKCRVASQRVQLRGTVQTTPMETRQPKQISDFKSLSFPHFPEAAQYIIHDLNEKKSKLESDLQSLKSEHKELKDEYENLEKSFDATKNALEKKPGALAGLFGDPDKLMSIIPHIPEVLRGLKETFKELVPQPQLGGSKIQDQPHDMLAWLSSKPLEVQTKFISMINGFSRLQDSELNNWVEFMNIKLPKAS